MGKRHHHGGDICGIVELVSTVLSALLLPYETYEVGVFPSCQNPYSGEAVLTTI